MKVGSLFSGGGLGDLGFVMAGCEIVFQVEIDDYCQKILELRYPDAIRSETIGQLNPQWVEWLMGVPIGWTDLNVSGTAKCLLARSGLLNE